MLLADFIATFMSRNVYLLRRHNLFASLILYFLDYDSRLCIDDLPKWLVHQFWLYVLTMPFVDLQRRLIASGIILHLLLFRPALKSHLCLTVLLFLLLVAPFSRLVIQLCIFVIFYAGCWAWFYLRLRLWFKLIYLVLNFFLNLVKLS